MQRARRASGQPRARNGRAPRRGCSLHMAETLRRHTSFDVRIPTSAKCGAARRRRKGASSRVERKKTPAIRLCDDVGRARSNRLQARKRADGGNAPTPDTRRARHGHVALKP
eukprot:CAMPEP_0176253506 /NCGR_PEP_ID=MMETSP0121_2-20121125/36050_1 /TAXON_ID=160619 /ORGANISM="Kryptoperidinium foliaceum, Strain CCMP 1326" /LENGTH=111 /DNA_ID=CAMNT_0017593283 /DNA_START=118 /DNA_END=449 /DNA_ORIENTATION=+